jgi:hypothetical protein
VLVGGMAWFDIDHQGNLVLNRIDFYTEHG